MIKIFNRLRKIIVGINFNLFSKNKKTTYKAGRDIKINNGVEINTRGNKNDIR